MSTHHHPNRKEHNVKKKLIVAIATLALLVSTAGSASALTVASSAKKYDFWEGAYHYHYKGTYRVAGGVYAPTCYDYADQRLGGIGAARSRTVAIYICWSA